jgi:hypothetical protein
MGSPKPVKNRQSGYEKHGTEKLAYRGFIDC